MFFAAIVGYDELSDEEKKQVPDNGNGKEEANYVYIVHNGKTIDILSDAIEIEDKTYSREFGQAVGAINDAYERGLADATKGNVNVLVVKDSLKLTPIHEAERTTFKKGSSFFIQEEKENMLFLDGLKRTKNSMISRDHLNLLLDAGIVEITIKKTSF